MNPSSLSQKRLVRHSRRSAVLIRFPMRTNLRNERLPSGTALQFSCLMDAPAGNDDTKFDVNAQRCASPTGSLIDL